MFSMSRAWETQLAEAQLEFVDLNHDDVFYHGQRPGLHGTAEAGPSRDAPHGPT